MASYSHLFYTKARPQRILLECAAIRGVVLKRRNVAIWKSPTEFWKLLTPLGNCGVSITGDLGFEQNHDSRP